MFAPTLSATQEPSRHGRFSEIEDAIALAHTYHFSWGYPDYIKQAFMVLQRLCCEYVPTDLNQQLTWKELRKALETADSEHTRFLVAGSHDAPINVLDYLSKDCEPRVARRVAENTRAHRATLTRLAEHPVAAVRMAVSENTSTPEGVLLKLTRDADADVRYVMAENANLPQAVLEILCSDENPYVSGRAATTLQRLNKGEVVVADFSRVARRRIGRAAL